MSESSAVRGAGFEPPGPYALFDLKEALGAAPLGRVLARYRDAVGVSGPAFVQETQALSLVDAARAVGRPYIETGPAGEPFVNRAPRVVGVGGDERDLRCETRTAFVASIANGRIRGRSGLIEHAGDVLIDAEDVEFARIDDRLSLEPPILRADGLDIAIVRCPREQVLKLERAFALTGTHTSAFGHWMWEYLPKYVAAVLSGALPAMPVVIDRGMPSTHREALSRLAPDGARIVEIAAHQAVEAEELWCSPTLNYMPVFERMNARFQWDYLASPPARFAPVLTRLCEAWRTARAPLRGDRVYLARRPDQRRKLVNREKIEEIARLEGFRVVYPQDLSFAQQAALMRDAEFIIGPEGSAMFLCFLAVAGAKVAILNHPHTQGLAVLTALLESSGLKTTVVTGPFEAIDPEWRHFSDYRIEEESFTAFLADWTNEAP